MKWIGKRSYVFTKVKAIFVSIGLKLDGSYMKVQARHCSICKIYSVRAVGHIVNLDFLLPFNHD